MKNLYKQFEYDKDFDCKEVNLVVNNDTNRQITNLNNLLKELLSYKAMDITVVEDQDATIKAVRLVMEPSVKKELDIFDQKIANYTLDDRKTYRLKKINQQAEICTHWLKQEIAKLQKRRMHLYANNLQKGGLFIHEVNGVQIPLNPNWKRIAVNLSGGADSACLTSILANIITENKLETTIDIITHTRVWEVRPWAGPVSIQVYKKLQKIWGNIIGERITNFIPTELEHGVIGNLNVLEDRSPDQVIVSRFNDYLGTVKKYDAIYNATTKNPSIDKELLDRMKNRDIENIDVETLAIPTNYGYWMISPLRFIEKDWIVEQYYKMDLVDLFETTRSCEGNQGNISLLDGLDVHWYNEDKEVPECGKCFWCKEREWAIKQVEQRLK